MLDTTREVEVPEGITLSLPVAGLVSRSLAFLTDLLIRFVVILIAAQIFSVLGNFGDGLIYIVAFFVEWFYPVLFEMFYHGQTLGKKLLGLMVINDDGTPIDWSSSIVRNLLRFADFLPAFYAFGFISMLFSRDFKRLGDFVAGTLVVHKLDLIQRKNLLEQDGLAPRISLTLEEQSALIGFSERASTMSQSRQNELANLLAPWMTAASNQSDESAATVQLQKVAKWLRGHA